MIQPAAGAIPGAEVAVLDIVIPVHNEERQLAASVKALLAELDRLPWSARVTIADNASTDGTAVIARRLARDPRIEVVTLAEKGRGRALKRVWSRSASAVLVYMDVDLSTDLNALLPLVAPLLAGHSDLAIGSRLARGSRVVRGPRREFISRGYNLLLRGALRARFSDAQCGFKAISRGAAELLLPLVHDDTWFFDTELLVLAERAGLRIHEVPVDWVDDPDSSVDVVRTALDDLRGITRVGRSLLRGELPLAAIGVTLGRTRLEASRGRVGMQVGVFAAIGVASTLAYAMLYVLFRPGTGAFTANLLALLITAVANTAANRRLTFGVRGGDGLWRHQAQGLVVFAAGVVVTSGSLAILRLAGVHDRWAEVAVLTAANLAVTVGRFLAMRLWIFRRTA